MLLPPVLWSAGYFTSWRDFRNDMRPITLLAVRLVDPRVMHFALIAFEPLTNHELLIYC